MLLTAAGASDPGLRADTLLAAVTAEQVQHWRREQNRPLSELSIAMAAISRCLTQP